VSINKVAIQKTLVPIIQDIVGPNVPVIFEDSNSRRPGPDKSYITLKLTNFYQGGQEEYQATDHNGITPIDSTYSMKFRFTGVNDKTATPISSVSWNLLNNPIVIDRLIGIGLSIITEEVELIDNPTFRNARFEEQTEFVVETLYVDTNDVDTSFINKVSVEGKFYEPGTQPEDYPDTDPVRVIRIQANANLTEEN